MFSPKDTKQHCDVTELCWAAPEQLKSVLSHHCLTYISLEANISILWDLGTELSYFLHWSISGSLVLLILSCWYSGEMGAIRNAILIAVIAYFAFVINRFMWVLPIKVCLITNQLVCIVNFTLLDNLICHIPEIPVHCTEDNKPMLSREASSEAWPTAHWRAKNYKLDDETIIQCIYI